MMRAVQRGSERISEADRTVGAKYFGASVPRREDPRLLRGEGRFVDDMKLPGMLHAAFVRSPHAHARITAIRTDGARRRRACARVFTFADLARFMKPLPLFGAVPPGLAARVDVTMRQAPQFALCRDVARYVGEIVAMVLAESRALRRGRRRAGRGRLGAAAGVVDTTSSRRRSRARRSSTRSGATTSASASAPASATPTRAFAEADVRVRERFHVQRYVGMPMETRGVVAQWDRRDRTLTTWNGTQVVALRPAGAGRRARAAAHKIRVDRARRGRRLRDQGQRLRGGPADPGGRDGAAAAR